MELRIRYNCFFTFLFPHLIVIQIFNSNIQMFKDVLFVPNRAVNPLKRDKISLRMNVYFGPNRILNIICLCQIVQIEYRILFLL